MRFFLPTASHLVISIHCPGWLSLACIRRDVNTIWRTWHSVPGMCPVSPCQSSHHQADGMPGPGWPGAAAEESSCVMLVTTVMWPPGQSLMSSELQSPVTSSQAVSQVELDFNFTRDSWASVHTRLLFLAPAAGNFVRDGKLVFIHIKIVCMFVFFLFSLTHVYGSSRVGN